MEQLTLKKMTPLVASRPMFLWSDRIRLTQAASLLEPNILGLLAYSGTTVCSTMFLVMKVHNTVAPLAGKTRLTMHSVPSSLMTARLLMGVNTLLGFGSTCAYPIAFDVSRWSPSTLVVVALVLMAWSCGVLLTILLCTTCRTRCMACVSTPTARACLLTAAATLVLLRTTPMSHGLTLCTTCAVLVLSQLPINRLFFMCIRRTCMQLPVYVQKPMRGYGLCFSVYYRRHTRSQSLGAGALSTRSPHEVPNVWYVVASASGPGQVLSLRVLLNMTKFYDRLGIPRSVLQPAIAATLFTLTVLVLFLTSGTVPPPAIISMAAIRNLRVMVSVARAPFACILLCRQVMWRRSTTGSSVVPVASRRGWRVTTWRLPAHYHLWQKLMSLEQQLPSELQNPTATQFPTAVKWQNAYANALHPPLDGLVGLVGALSILLVKATGDLTTLLLWFLILLRSMCL